MARKIEEDPVLDEGGNDEGSSSVLRGQFHFADGSVYEGEYQVLQGEKQRSGRGVFRCGAEVYEGAWRKDRMHGRGRYEFASGDVFEGEFEEDQFWGQGKYSWIDGARYDGYWRCGRMHGKGCYVNKDGVKWEGEFCNGKYNNGSTCFSLR